jgi:nucleoid-associated protein YgaU
VATSEQPPTTADRTGATRPDASANPSENGAGPAARVQIVEPHDTLWDIAVAHLAPADRSAANVHRYWQQVYQRNRTVIGADPDLIHPGIRLEVPPYHRGRR